MILKTRRDPNLDSIGTVIWSKKGVTWKVFQDRQMSLKVEIVENCYGRHFSIMAARAANIRFGKVIKLYNVCIEVDWIFYVYYIYYKILQTYLLVELAAKLEKSKTLLLYENIFHSCTYFNLQDKAIVINLIDYITNMASPEKGADDTF